MIDRRTAPYAALLLRVVLGALFMLHIYRKFFITGIDAWWENLAHNGYPPVVIIYVLIAEFCAAVALPLGLWTRWISLLALPLIAGAAHFWLIRKGFWFGDAGGEFPLLWAAGLLVLALLGDGAYALRWPRRVARHG
jgi:putative oxidoreductase